MRECVCLPIMSPTASALPSRTHLEVIPIHIHIGKVRTLSVENWQTIPDDRQQLLEIVGGAVVQDFGHVTEGDRISCAVVVTARDWEKIKGYWDSRAMVSVTDEGGNILPSMRVVVKSYEYMAHFPKVYKLSLEFWRV